MEWFTSDWHLGHKSCLQFDKRPYKNLNEMNIGLIRNINNLVRDDDILYILGDVAFKVGNTELIASFLNKINCQRKILILGNHDKFNPFAYVEAGFESVHTSLEVGDYILIHDPAVAGTMKYRKFICGHVHKLFRKLNNVINVSCCMWEYLPVSKKQIDEMFNKGEI